MTLGIEHNSLIANYALKKIKRIKAQNGRMMSLLTLTTLAACSGKTYDRPLPDTSPQAGFTENPTGTFTGTDLSETLDQASATANLTVNAAGGDDVITTGSGADTIDGGTGADTIYSGAGDDVVTAGDGNDLIRGGLGVDTLTGGVGDDIFVLVGTTSAGQYVDADIANPGGSGIDLSSLISLSNLNDQAESEAAVGESIDGGAGTNTLVIYGDTDLRDLTITNINTLQVNSRVQMWDEQLMGLTVVRGSGDSILEIFVPDNGMLVELDFSGLDLSDIAELHIFGTAVSLAQGSAEALSGVGAIIFNGTVGNDEFTGSDSAETYNGSDGDDMFTPNGGNDVINGGVGTDVVALSGSVFDYSFTDNGDGHWTVVGEDGSNELYNIERISFTLSPSANLTSNTSPWTFGSQFEVAENASLNITSAELTANDFDFEGDALSITGLTFADGSLLEGNITTTTNDDNSIATISVNAGTDFDYLAVGETYEEMVSTTVFDGTTSVESIFSVTVTGTNDAPVLTGFITVVDIDTAAGALGSVTSTDADTGDSVGYAITAGNDALLFSIDETTGEVSSTGTLDTSGDYILTVTGTDDAGDSDTTDVTITVGAANAAPTVEANKTIALGEAAATTELHIAAPTDVDGDTLTITVSGIPDNGTINLAGGAAITLNQTLTIAELQGLTFTTGVGSEGSSSNFAYEVDDGNGVSVTGTVTTNVAAPSTGVVFWSSTVDTGQVFFTTDGTTVSVVGNPPAGGIDDNHQYSSADFVTLNGAILFRGKAEGSNATQIWSFDGSTYTQITNLPAGGIWDLHLVGGDLYFYAQNADGWGIYWTDGVTSGQVAALGTTVPSSNFDVIEIGGQAYIGAFDVNGGTYSWWEVNGSTAILAIDPADAGLPVATTGDVHYFAHNDGVSGWELWVFDGTNKQLVADINPGAGGAVNGAHILEYGTGVVFVGNNGVDGTEFYYYDGTTVQEFDINPGNANSNPREFTAYNGLVYFSATDGSALPPEDPWSTQSELWVFDGTDVLKAAGSPFHSITTITLYGDTLYISGTAIIDGVAQYYYVAAYDGTTYTPIELPDSNGAYAYPFMSGTYLDGIIYFSGGTYDGTTFDTLDNPFGDTQSSNPQFIAEYNGEFLFIASDGVTSTTNFSTDGTTITAMTATDIEALRGIANSIEFQGKLYFTSTYDATAGNEIWVYDGTTASLLIDLTPGTGGLQSNVIEMMVFNGQLYFVARSDTSGVELWSYDGVNDPVLFDLNIGAGYSNPRDLTVAGSQMLFYTNPSNGVYELWTTDGVNPPTLIQGGLRFLSDLTVSGNFAYFKGNDVTNGTELWQWPLDGSSAPVVVDINIGTGNSLPDNFTDFNGLLVFTADNGTDGDQLYSYNGAGTPTQITNATGFAPDNFYVLGTTLYFTAADGRGRELWSFDGATITFEVDLAPDSTSSSSNSNIKYFDVGGELIITDITHIWSYDGTTLTVISEGDYYQNLELIGDKLYLLTAKELPDGTNAGGELWVYDGITFELIEDLNAVPTTISGEIAMPDPGAAASGLVLTGGAGNDVLVSSSADDTMTGGAGADIFVFDAAFGNDTINDFTAGAGTDDFIDLSALGITDTNGDTVIDINDLTIADNGDGNAVVDLGADGTLTLIGVSTTSLHSDDFIF